MSPIATTLSPTHADFGRTTMASLNSARNKSLSFRNCFRGTRNARSSRHKSAIDVCGTSKRRDSSRIPSSRT